MTEEVSTRPNNIVILGGSIGGLGTAHYLLRHVVRDFPDHKVIVVSPNQQFLWRPACPRALVRADFSNDKRLLVNISDLLKQYPSDQFEHVIGVATSLDEQDSSITVRRTGGNDETLKFDALIVATGASTTSPLLGLTGDDSVLIESWKTFQNALSTAERIVIAGGGPAGIETAGELGELLNGRKGWFGGPKRKASITVVTSASQILPHLRPSIAQTAENYLTDLGVEILKNTKVESASPLDAGTANALISKSTILLSSGSSISADLYIPAVGTTPNTAFLHQSLLGSDGRVEVDPSTLRVTGSNARIYAIGDASNYARPAIHNMFDAVPTLCVNMKHDLLTTYGREEEAASEDRKYAEDTRETQFVPIGSGRGVGAAMGWRLPSWLVSLVKGKNYMLWTTGGITSGKQWAKA